MKVVKSYQILLWNRLWVTILKKDIKLLWETTESNRNKK